MIRKNKLFLRPHKMYEAARIKEENQIVEKYGLKNKREIWKSAAKINYYRSRAKALARAPMEEQKNLFGKLTALGIKVNSISDVLALKIENLLDRRLPSIMFKKNLAKTTKQARQMVVHKNVLVNGNVVNTPSYIVPVSEENSITLKVKIKKPKVEAPKEIAKEAPETKEAK